MSRSPKAKHHYDPHETCDACYDPVGDVEFGCRQQYPGLLHWAAVELHVMRALAREDWVLNDVYSGTSSPAELVYSRGESQIEWVYAVMYLLGWKRPNWALDWEWI